jgi:RNA polymerase sigma-70 factor (ECF subfamily)
MGTIVEVNSAVTNGRRYHCEGLFKRRIPLVPICSINLETSDDDLIKLIAIKDKRAMRALYMRHNQKVFRFLVRLTNDASIAEDVVSDVFLEVWRSASHFKGKSAVSTWLLSIARNEAYSALRRCREAPLDEGYAITIEDPANNPEVTTDNKDRSSILQRCLKSLSPAHREVIDLVYYREKSIGEVAEITGVPLATVKTRAFYARNQLAQMLKECGVQHAIS